jgi:sensor domain CHASE-containing protein
MLLPITIAAIIVLVGAVLAWLFRDELYELFLEQSVDEDEQERIWREYLKKKKEKKYE